MQGVLKHNYGILPGFITLLYILHDSNSVSFTIETYNGKTRNGVTTREEDTEKNRSLGTELEKRLRMNMSMKLKRFHDYLLKECLDTSASRNIKITLGLGVVMSAEEIEGKQLFSIFNFKDCCSNSSTNEHEINNDSDHNGFDAPNSNSDEEGNNEEIDENEFDNQDSSFKQFFNKTSPKNRSIEYYPAFNNLMPRNMQSYTMATKKNNRISGKYTDFTFLNLF